MMSMCRGCKCPPVREMRPSLLQRFCRSCQSYQRLSRTQPTHSDIDTNICNNFLCIIQLLIVRMDIRQPYKQCLRVSVKKGQTWSDLVPSHSVKFTSLFSSHETIQAMMFTNMQCLSH